MLKCPPPVSEALEAVPVDGEVVIIGTAPGAVAMTPEAALETCKRVVDAAAEALKQRASGTDTAS